MSDKPDWLKTKRRIEKARIVIKNSPPVDYQGDSRLTLHLGEKLEMMPGDSLVIIDKFTPPFQGQGEKHLFEVWFVADGETPP